MLSRTLLAALAMWPALAYAAPVDDRNPVINDGAGVVVGVPTGGQMGAGTVNAQGGLYVNGNAVPTAIGTSILQPGIKCDGTTDDTTGINAYLATLTSGGTVYIPAGRYCLINSGNLTVPANVVIVGEAAPWPGKGQVLSGSGFLLNPADTVNLGTSAVLNDVGIIRSGLQANPTDAQAIADVNQWAAENSRGITITGQSVRLDHVFVEGFNTCVHDISNTYFINDLQGDCANGLYASQVGSNTVADDLRMEPYYSINSTNAVSGEGIALSASGASGATTLQFAAGAVGKVQVGDYAAIGSGADTAAITYGTTVIAVNNTTGVVTLSQPLVAAVTSGDYVEIGGSWARPGFAIYMQGNGGNNTGWYCNRCHSFLYRYGAIIQDTGVGYLSYADFEYQSAYDPDGIGYGTAGVRVVGLNSGVHLEKLFLIGHAIEFSNEMGGHYLSADEVSLGPPDQILTVPGFPVGANAVAQAYFQGASSAPPTLTFSTNIPSGQAVSVTINGTTVSYTGLTGENWATDVGMLTRLINTTPALAAAHISAQWSNNTIAIYAPAATTLSVSAGVPSGVTVTQGTGTAGLGAWGTFTNLDYSAALPGIIVGPNDGLPLALGVSEVSNTGGPTPANVFSIDSTDLQVQFTNWPTSSTSISRLSGCGTGPALSTNAMDSQGVITEGTSATGCTLTFRTTFPRIPVCIVSTANGGPEPTVTATATALTITNSSASGAEYGYRCFP